MIRFFLLLGGYIWFITFLYSQDVSEKYSFFVAGHTYGEPGVNNAGFHPPFKAAFPIIQNRESIQFGILTGDIVSPSPTAQDWDEIDTDILDLGLPVYFAVGNHDMEDRPLFESRYGATYYHFSFRDDLFIVLDPNLNGWSIKGDQLEYLQDLLSSHSATHHNVFIFMHQLIWVEDDNSFGYINFNSSAGRIEPVNFWTEVEPLLQSLENQIFIFAGDIGVEYRNDVVYDSYNNISFIASGMGDYDKDNFLIVDVKDDKDVEIDIICLESNVDCLGDIHDYQVVFYSPSFNRSSSIAVYPNPSRMNLYLSANDPSELIVSVQIHDLTGRLIAFENIIDAPQYTVKMNSQENGVYVLSITTNLSQYRQLITKH